MILDMSDEFLMKSMINALKRDCAKLVIHPDYEDHVSLPVGKVVYSKAVRTNEMYVIDMEKLESGRPINECVLGKII